MIFALAVGSMVLGLFLATLVDSAQLFVKTKGISTGKVAGAYNNAMKIMLLNRLGAILFVSGSSILIDNNISGFGLIQLYFAPIILILISYLIIMYKRRLFKIRINFLYVFMYILNLLSLMLPYYLAANSQSWTLTLSNSGFLLNTIVTFINLFVVEKKLASILDSKSQQLVRPFESEIMCSRLVAAIFVLSCLGFYYYQH
jgi:hypothetical protein